MKSIGLIGGMSWESSCEYYRIINETVKVRLGGLHSAKIIMVSVDFAEIEQFIDTPVKHYSSGMYVRLAFSVAAHLEPEILLIDEVLAVGDVAFQKKSLGKMEDVSHQGRTVVFVSHNMNALQRLCPNSILLNHGHVVLQGKTSSSR